MTFPSKSKVILYVAAVFVAGMAAGWATGFTQAKQKYLAPPRPKRMASDVLLEYRRELALTPDQVARIEPIINVTGSNLHQLHEATMDQVKAAIRKSDDQIDQLLTAEQKTRFEQMRAKRAQSFSKKQRNP